MIGFNSIEIKRKKEKKLSRERQEKEKKRWKKRGRKYRRGKRGRLLSTSSRIPSCSFSGIVSPPSNHHLSLMATPSTSSSPAASTNFQLVLSDHSETSGYFRFKPASLSKDKILSMECKVMLKKLPPTNATVFKIQEYESLDIPSSSRGKAVRGGTGRNPGTKNWRQISFFQFLL